MAGDYRVTVLPVGVEFDCDEDEPLLTAATRAGLVLPYGCRKGNCGTCKAQILDGEADLEIESAYTISDFERDQGFTLLCSATPMSDLTVEMEGLDADTISTGVPADEIHGVVSGVRPLTADLRALRVELESPLSFRAGQFAELSLGDPPVTRAYSMASAPSATRRVDFIIKRIPGGALSSRLDVTEPGDWVELSAPHGSFWVRDGRRPLLLVAGGAGMAPVWSMLQDLAVHRDPRPVYFFYGARSASDLFYLDQIEALGGTLPGLRFTPCLSDSFDGAPDDCEKGLVTDVVERVLGSDIAEHDAYLCGPPPMIDAALDLLEKHGLRERHEIFYDKFTQS